MLFINDIQHLSENFKSQLNPRPYVLQETIGYCVYGYLREEDDQYGPKHSIRYIGEGKPTRPTAPHSNVRIPAAEHIVIFIDNLSKIEARIIELELILHYGGICNSTGILENKRPFTDKINFNKFSYNIYDLADATLMDTIPVNHKFVVSDYKKYIPDDDWF